MVIANGPQQENRATIASVCEVVPFHARFAGPDMSNRVREHSGEVASVIHDHG